MDINATIATILAEASAEDLDAIFDAVRTRRATLNRQTAAKVVVGMRCRLDGLSPRYLNGLQGTVVSITGSRAVVALDEVSTMALRYTRHRSHIAPGSTTCDLPGVPLACVHAA